MVSATGFPRQASDTGDKEERFGTGRKKQKDRMTKVT